MRSKRSRKINRIELKEIIVGGIGNWTQESKRIATFYRVVRGLKLETKGDKE